MAGNERDRSVHADPAPEDWTRPPVRIMTGLIITALSAAALALSLSDRAPGEEFTTLAQVPERKIDLNSAGVDELQLLPGIGPAIAARIVEDREANGLFPDVESLTRVRGVGPRTVINITRYTIADAREQTTKTKTPQMSQTP